MKFKRRRYIVNTGFQVRFTLLFVLVALLGNIASVLVFNFFALKKLEAFMWSSHITETTTGEIIKPLFMYVNIIDFLFVSVLLTITGVWMLRKVSGPVYRMSKDIRRVAEGDLSTTITLRQKDEFEDIANELNTMVKSIREKFKNISGKYSGISKSIGEFRKKISKPGGVIKSCSSILEDIENLETEIKNFKLGNRGQ